MFAAFIVHRFEGSRFCGVWSTREEAQQYLETFFENDSEREFEIADCYYVVRKIEINNPKSLESWTFEDLNKGWEKWNP